MKGALCVCVYGLMVLRMLGGASRKDCGSGSRSSTGTSNDSSAAQAPQQQNQHGLKPSSNVSEQLLVCLKKESSDSLPVAGSSSAAQQLPQHVSSSISSMHTEAAHNDAGDAGLAREATDMSLSGDDWHADDGCSSLDGSAPTSLSASVDENQALRAAMAAAGQSSSSSSSASLAVLGSQPLRQQRDGVSKVAGSPGMCGWSIPAPDSLDELYGQVVRVMVPGETFGEVALLNKSATRTATVVGTPALPASGKAATAQAAEIAHEQDGITRPDDAEPGVLHTNHQGRNSHVVATAELPPLEGDGVIELIRLSRSCYDATVRAVQVGGQLGAGRFATRAGEGPEGGAGGRFVLHWTELPAAAQ
jgi:hypothetical protein